MSKLKRRLTNPRKASVAMEEAFSVFGFHEPLPTSLSSLLSAAAAPALADGSVGLLFIGSAFSDGESATLRLFSSNGEDIEEVLRRLRGAGA